MLVKALNICHGQIRIFQKAGRSTVWVCDAAKFQSCSRNDYALLLCKFGINMGINELIDELIPNPAINKI